MKVILRHRRYGVHRPVKETVIDGSFTDYCQQRNAQDYVIKEQKIIDAFPDGFLPVEPEKILVTIGDKHGSIGQYDLNIFRYWEKYFDAYVLELMKDE